ncbi:inner membrane protein [Pedobacter sp. UYP30]|uniref:cell envelope integrity protein CreD n=1 Tax=Pedobacter sp. UYP30 TaxID=1756400 RepID=UPI0033919EE6
MDTQEQQQQPVNGFAKWFGESVLVKLLLIGLLTLILLIPSSLIQNLIHERQTRQEEVTSEISDKWGDQQLVEGPVMVLPYKKFINDKDPKGKITTKEVITNVYILPEQLNMESKVVPQIRHRGIFDAVVYDTKVSVSGKFSELELEKSGINPNMIQWDKAKIVIGLSDLKGMKNNPNLKLGGINYQVEPDFTSVKLFSNNLIALPDLSASKSTSLNFGFDLELRGSKELNFLPLGKSTKVHVSGNWNNPSFTGRYLPENPDITNSNFTANWKIPYFNRPFPQQWEEANTSLISKSADASFGVKFMLSIDQYQKTMRTAKYGILIVLLTFISLFFTELLNKKKVHLLQYVLIGAAMIIYYALLLSFSEQVGFNIAYLIASVATIALISVFIASVLKNKKAALIFAVILSIFYGFIFVIIQLQDLALLCGSIGLFIIIAAMMFLSSKIDWNKRIISQEQ